MATTWSTMSPPRCRVRNRRAPTPCPSTRQVAMLGNQTSSRPMAQIAAQAASPATVIFLVIPTLTLVRTVSTGLSRGSGRRPPRTRSLDHLVRAQQQRGRDRQVEDPRGPRVDVQVEL